MDVLTIFSTLLRRWKVVAAVSLLTAIALGGIVLRAEPTYEMRGSFLVTQRTVGDTGAVVPDPDADGEEQGLGQGDVPAVLNPVLVAEAVQDGEVVESIRAQGGTSSYQVHVDGDLLRVVATDLERSTVVPTVTGVLDAIDKEVTAVQADAGVPAERQAVVELVAVPSDASVQGEVTRDQGVEYSARGTARLVGPGVGGYNPYADSRFTVRILEEVLAGEAAHARVVEAGGTGAYSIEQEDRDTAPIVYLTATGETAEEAARTFAAARDVASDELETRQAGLGAPEGSRIGLFELSVPSEPSELTSGLARPLITVAGLGGVAAVGLALLVDNLAQALRRRLEARSLEAATDGDDQAGTLGPDETDVPVPEAATGAASEAPSAAEAPSEEEAPAASEAPVAGEAQEPQPVVVPDDDSSTRTRSGDAKRHVERVVVRHGTLMHKPLRAAGNGNGKADLARQAHEAVYLAVLDRVSRTTPGPTKPAPRELLARTPTDVR